MEVKQLYREIPHVNLLLEEESMKKLAKELGREVVLEAVRQELELLRRLIREGISADEFFERKKSLTESVRHRAYDSMRCSIRQVINASGTVLHTNLGRAPISRAHMEKMTELMTGYFNLEFDLETGKRGDRYEHVEELLCRLTGAEAAMAVNNNAASVLLILNTLGKGGEAIVSRGELIEIGGKFRIPDVMEQSGVTLREVGTTNKTHLEDYEQAIEENTRLLLKVHTSNYQILGFTKAVDASELAPLAAHHGLPLVEDLGSGVMIPLEKLGLHHLGTVQESVEKGCDVICFSGDKLLGGPQAGIIIGKEKYISRMKKNPLTRALRIDKFTALALELVLLEYLSEEKAIENIPTLQLLARSCEEIRSSAEACRKMLLEKNLMADFRVEDCVSHVGGGCLPLEELPSAALVIRPAAIGVEELAVRLRRIPLPVIGRLEKDAMILDFRTVPEELLTQLAAQLGNPEIYRSRDCGEKNLVRIDGGKDRRGSRDSGKNPGKESLTEGNGRNDKCDSENSGKNPEENNLAGEKGQ